MGRGSLTMTFATANKDTYITSMNDPEVDCLIPQGQWMFHITSPNQVKYLEPGEIAIWDRTRYGVFYGYAKDWDIE
jgi:hypothetical protein